MKSLSSNRNRAAGPQNAETGVAKGLTSYGDQEFSLLLQTVTQADKGVDFDFLRAATVHATIPGAK